MIVTFFGEMKWHFSTYSQSYKHTIFNANRILYKFQLWCRKTVIQQRVKTPLSDYRDNNNNMLVDANSLLIYSWNHFWKTSNSPSFERRCCNNTNCSLLWYRLVKQIKVVEVFQRNQTTFTHSIIEFQLIYKMTIRLKSFRANLNRTRKASGIPIISGSETANIAYICFILYNING